MRVPPRVLAWTVASVVAVAFAWDATRAPHAQWAARSAVAAIRVYQRTASPLMPRVGIRCRFSPTCSRYASAVIERYGILRGTSLAIWRIARCGPWTHEGTKDPPP